MRVFIDANVLISVLNKEYPLFSYSSRVLSLASSKNFTLFTSPICLAIAFYFAEKKFRSVIAKEKIRLLCAHINIAAATEWCVKNAVMNKSVLDLEDGMEYYAALENKCECIITEDIEDFYFSEIEILQTEMFFEKYMMKKRG